MNATIAKYAVGALAGIGLVVWIWIYRGNMKDAEWKARIETAPVVTTSDTGKPWMEPMPVEHLSDTAKPTMPSEVIVSTHLKRAMDSLQDELLDCYNQNDSLESFISSLETAQFTVLRDSVGGRHDITYNPILHRFYEDYTPVRIMQPITITNTKTVPINTEKSWMIGFGSEYHGGLGIGGLVGKKPYYVKPSYYPDEEKKWGITLGVIWEW